MRQEPVGRGVGVWGSNRPKPVSGDFLFERPVYVGKLPFAEFLDKMRSRGMRSFADVRRRC